MRIDITAGDSPGFIRSVDTLLASVLERHRPTRLYLVRVDGWFGGKWFRFSGKALGAVGIVKSQLTLPPFVPSRIVSQHVLELPDYRVTPTDAALHVKQRSSQNFQRRVANLYPDSSFLWFSGDTERNQRGSTMAYLATHEDGWAWYAGWVCRDGWRPAAVRGITTAEVEELACAERRAV